MDKSSYDFLKVKFFNLTGKNAEDNLEAFFNYVNVLNLMDIKDTLKIIRLNQPDPNAGLNNG